MSFLSIIYLVKFIPPPTRANRLQSRDAKPQVSFLLPLASRSRPRRLGRRTGENFLNASSLYTGQRMHSGDSFVVQDKPTFTQQISFSLRPVAARDCFLQSGRVRQRCRSNTANARKSKYVNSLRFTQARYTRSAIPAIRSLRSNAWSGCRSAEQRNDDGSCPGPCTAKPVYWQAKPTGS